MKYIIFLILFVTILFYPAYAQSEKNPSIVTQTVEVPYDDFNTMARDTIVTSLEELHVISWQVSIENNLVYANPNGNAVIRFYDLNIPEKFIEIGMGSNPDEKFWVAVQIPDDTGYVVIHNNLERGWTPGSIPTLSYTEKGGLTVNNGQRIVISNLGIGSFQISSYSVYGMESSTDPPATNSGTLTLNFISGDPAQNPFYLFPFFLVGGIGIFVAILLVTKKRS